ncbi:MAG: lamin tail domain-containing protein [Candidatus Symbiothrix sp.]|jgi:Na+-transporting methylmalonyl-CoA/oxaloacetate decarboxylase gamma subunit|nr:lamin tail domain-containing protein [Candidatus Symbiothrix sp.]
MMKQKIKLGLLFLLIIVCNVQAQRTTALRINEVLVINEDNFVDDYGKRFPWVEIYNSSPGTVNIAGCFLTDDINNPKKYMVPKGDVLTRIRPRQHALFWADNIPTRGTFHLNFELNPKKPNFIALFDSDGTSLIDSVTVPAGQRADISYGLIEDGWNQERLNEALRLNENYKNKYGDQLWIYWEKVTPSSNNKILDTNEKIENFKINDGVGIGMTMTAMGVVFAGLIILYLIFKSIGNIAVSLSHQRVMKASGVTKEQARNITDQSGDVYAAIAIAIYEATELHDEENTILTIKNTARNYSPWNSKIYTLREIPKR